MQIADYIKTILLNQNYNNHLVTRYIKLLETANYLDRVTEVHHILPRSIFPEFTDDLNNLRRIPAKLHFLVHIILAKMTNLNSMWTALFLMSGKSDYKLKSSRWYEKSKIEHLRFHQERMKDGTHPFHKSNHVNCKGESWYTTPVEDYNREVWWVADEIVDLIANNKHDQLKSIYRRCRDMFNRKHMAYSTIGTIMGKYYNENWSPRTDEKWLKFKRENSFNIKSRKTFHLDKTEPWFHGSGNESSRLTWYLALIFYEMHNIYPEYGWSRLFTLCDNLLDFKEIFEFDISPKVCKCMLNRFRNGWKPFKDNQWLAFYSLYANGLPLEKRIGLQLV